MQSQPDAQLGVRGEQLVLRIVLSCVLSGLILQFGIDHGIPPISWIGFAVLGASLFTFWAWTLPRRDPRKTDREPDEHEATATWFCRRCGSPIENAVQHCPDCRSNLKVLPLRSIRPRADLWTILAVVLLLIWCIWQFVVRPWDWGPLFWPTLAVGFSVATLIRYVRLFFPTKRQRVIQRIVDLCGWLFVIASGAVAFGAYLSPAGHWFHLGWAILCLSVLCFTAFGIVAPVLLRCQGAGEVSVNSTARNP
jgi:hypothetical protein